MPIGREKWGTGISSPVMAFMLAIKKPEYLNITNIPTSVSIDRIRAVFAFFVPLFSSIVHACL